MRRCGQFDAVVKKEAAKWADVVCAPARRLIEQCGGILETARALGIRIPNLLRADNVIE